MFQKFFIKVNKYFFLNKKKAVINLWVIFIEAIFKWKIKKRKEPIKKINKNNLKYSVPEDDGFLILPKNFLSKEKKDVLNDTDIIIKNFFENDLHNKLFTTTYGDKTKQHFNSLLFREHLNNLKYDSPFLKLALNPDLLKCISKYLGQIPRLNVIEIMYSRYLPEVKSSAMFHTDAEYNRQIKLFIYGNDVLDQQYGPLTLLSAKNSEKVMKNTNYLSNKIIETDLLNSIVGQKDHKIITGTKGTSFLVDTSRNFHLGSKILNPEKYRITIMFQYLPFLSFKKWFDFSHLINPKFDQIQNLVLNSKGLKKTFYKSNYY